MGQRKPSTAHKFTLLLLIVGSFVAGCSSNSTTVTPAESVTKNPEPTDVFPTSQDSIPEPSATIRPIVEASPTKGETSDGEPLPAGQLLLQERCTECHSLSRVRSKSKTLEEWKATVKKMVGKGADLVASEQVILIDYLAETYP